MTGSAMAELSDKRQAAGLALAERKGAELDIADLTETEFERGLERLKTAQARMKKILETALVEGAHYGNPVSKSGKPVFKKPILLIAGAEELARLLRLMPVQVGNVELERSEDYVSATVTIAHQDSVGRLLCPRTANCNSREKRFQKFDGSGYTYDDARETVHDCISMAQKRAIVASIRAASGATAFLAAEELMDEALDKPITPWTEAEKKSVYDAAGKKGIGRAAFARLVKDTIGTDSVGTGEDVQKLLAAIEAWTKDAPLPVKEAKAKMEGNVAPLSSDGYGKDVEPGDAQEPEGVDA